MQVAEIKPRLRKIGNHWFCYTNWDHIPSAGKTPKEAYEKFLQKNKSRI